MIIYIKVETLCVLYFTFIMKNTQFLEVECVTKCQIIGYAAIKLPQMSYTVPNNRADRTSSSYKWWLCISQHAEVLSTEQSIIKEKQSNNTLD